MLAGTGSVDLAMAQSNAAQLWMLAADLDGTRGWADRAMQVLAGCRPDPGWRRSGCTC